MDKKKSKENRSMYLYTALIFVVALLLILLAFFGQTNISRLGNRANEFKDSAPVPTQILVSQEEYARMSNMAAALDTENKTLTADKELSDKLIGAFKCVADGNPAEASALLEGIDATALSEDRLALYNDITEKINEGENK